MSGLTHLVALRNPAIFTKKKNQLILQVLGLSSIIVFVLETLVMLALGAKIFQLPMALANILDGFILIVILLPINYIFIVRPMVKQIEEHHRTNQKLLESNEILERFFSISDILIAYLDKDFRFIRVNQAYSATDGIAPEDYVGKNYFDLFPNEENKAIFLSVIKTGEPYFAVEKPFTYAAHPERGVSYWDWSLMPVKEADGSVTALILVLNNVTARKKAQQALEESVQRFRAVFNQTFQHGVLLDPTGQVLLVNQTALDFSGLDQDQTRGMALWEVPWWVTVPPHSPSETTQQIQAAIQLASQGEIYRGELRVRADRGEAATLDVTIKPVLDEQARTFLLVYEARDITQRIAIEEALIRSENRIKTLYRAEIRAREFAETLQSAVLALSGSLNSETVLETLLDFLKRAVPYTSAHVLLLEGEDYLVVRLERGTENWSEGKALLGQRIDMVDLPFLQPLFKERKVLSVSDTLFTPTAVFLPDDRPVLSWLGLPLMAGNQVVGACLLEHMCPGFFTDDLVQWATALTSQAAMAIQNAWLFEQVRDGRAQLQALSRSLVEVQENERHYIARELHDEAGQVLASLMIGLRNLERESKDPATVMLCIELKQTVDNVLESLHRLAMDLRPAALDHLGLVAALRQHAIRFSDETGLTVQFEAVGKIERMSGDIETAVYRIVQEALTNVVRHAHATRIDILLERRGADLVVVVEDNGIGFDLHSDKRLNRLGVIGMKERADMLGGIITIESVLGQGTTVLLEVPCPFES